MISFIFQLVDFVIEIYKAVINSVFEVNIKYETGVKLTN